MHINGHRNGEERFKPPTSESEMMEIIKGFGLKNNKKSTIWASHVFEEWVLERNVFVKELRRQGIGT